MSLPTPRGPLSSALLLDLAAGGGISARTLAVADQTAATPVPLADEDLQLALYVCYELRYRGFPEIDDRWEWDPALLRLRLPAVLDPGSRRPARGRRPVGRRHRPGR